MTKFLFKSDKSDLSKMLAILETLQKNTLYITYRVDALIKKINTMDTDKGLQKQVDEYFEEDGTSKRSPSEISESI